jgi:hypothetical protein
MPTVSWFYGIAIRMYFVDHGRPHFHAYYGNDVAVFDVETGRVLRGGLPPAALRLVREWRELHADALMRNWTLIRSNRPFERIPGLDASKRR